METIRSVSFKSSSNKDHDKIVHFTMKKPAKMAHQSGIRYNIFLSMQAKTEFFCKKLQLNSSFPWETPLAFLIKRKPCAMACDDAYLDIKCGYSIPLKCWWHFEFKDEIVL